MLTKEDIIAILRQNYPHLAAKYGVKRVGLFGSYGKDTSVEQSDIDLLIEFNRPIGFEFIELSEYLEALLGKRVDILTPAGVEDIRVERVAADIKDSVFYV